MLALGGACPILQVWRGLLSPRDVVVPLGGGLSWGAL